MKEKFPIEGYDFHLVKGFWKCDHCEYFMTPKDVTLQLAFEHYQKHEDDTE